MSLNFFDENYVREICSISEFGLCDGNNEKKEPAYICCKKEEKESWGAIIINTNCVEITFLPVDNNISIIQENGNMAKRCDGILFVHREDLKSISFVELKERTDKQNKTWRKDGVEQLISTITAFSTHHNINEYSLRRAFVCNRKRPNYAYSNREELSAFREHYNVSLYIQPSIVV